MINKRIKFDEKYENEEYNTTTLYFTAPKELLKTYLPHIPYETFKDAISMEISIEFPIGYADDNSIYASVSPTRETEGGTEDYDWYEIYLPYNDFLELKALAEKAY